MHIGQDPTSILSAIRATLRKYDIAPSRFGREAVNDPRVVFDLEQGRTIKPRTVARLRSHIERMEAAHV
jgi:hypothetical protein